MEIIRYTNKHLLEELHEADMTVKELVSLTQRHKGNGWDIPIKIIIPDKESNHETSKRNR